MKALQFVKEHYLLLSILLLATVLRVYHIDFQSIWLDEIHTMIETNPDLSMKEFYDVIMFREGMGHLYFLSLRWLYEIFGYSTFTARMVSAGFGVASIYVVYLLGKELYNRNAGLIAALLLTVNMFHISYSQEARPYMLWLLLTAVGFYRLLIFIRKPSVKNAVWFGLLTGFAVHAHPVGLITVFSQGLLLLAIVIKTPKAERMSFIKNCLFALLAFIIAFLPMIRMFLKMNEYKSGWLTLPGPDGFTQIFHLFLGNTELLAFIFNLVLIFFFLNLFQRSTNFNLAEIKEEKLTWSGIVLFFWMFLSILIPIVKSYLDEPMILHRYFIHLLPALILALAIGIELIRNKTAKICLLVVILSFGIVDISIIKKYYSTVTKSQFREVSEVILKSKDDDKVVSSFGWLMSYFFIDSGNNTVEMPLAEYVAAMRNNSIPMESFWYMDGNARPYTLSPEDEEFLRANFRVKRSIDRLDSWTKHYVAKVEIQKPKENSSAGALDLKRFHPYNGDSAGNLMMYENGVFRSPILNLEKGDYIIVLTGNSTPEVPLNGENAHLTIKLNSEEIGEVSLSENKSTPEKRIPFTCDENIKGRIMLIFDNDQSVNNIDRNAVIYSVRIDKK